MFRMGSHYLARQYQYGNSPDLVPEFGQTPHHNSRSGLDEYSYLEALPAKEYCAVDEIRRDDDIFHRPGDHIFPRREDKHIVTSPHADIKIIQNYCQIFNYRAWQGQLPFSTYMRQNPVLVGCGSHRSLVA